jgi:hypothetical protein
MFRRVLLGAGAVALVVSASAGLGSGVAMAAPTPISYSGSITCAVTGSAKFSSPLINGGTQPATVTVKARLKGCTDAADGGVTITKGTLLATSTGTVAANCGPVLGGESLPTLNGEIKWKATGGSVDPSTVVIAEPSVDYDVNGNSITTLLPTSVSAGSDSPGSATFGGLGSNKGGYKLDSECSGGGLHSVAFGNPGASHSGTVTIEEGGS